MSTFVPTRPTRKPCGTPVTFESDYVERTGHHLRLGVIVHDGDARRLPEPVVERLMAWAMDYLGVDVWPWDTDVIDATRVELSFEVPRA